PACAAAMSSSGLVPLPCSKRVENEYWALASTPLAVEITPCPSFNPPCQRAEADRFMFPPEFQDTAALAAALAMFRTAWEQNRVIIVYIPMHGIWQDLRYGLRGLRKRPSFTLLAVLALALGIGAATTIFSAIHGVLLDPFPYTNAERVVQVMIHDLTSSRPGGRMYYSVPEFLDIQEQNHVFDGIIGGTFEDIMIPNGEGSDQLMGGSVTANMFDFLGVPAQLGRTLTPDDAKSGAPPVFVMSYK